jgi:hypothetical protein
MMFIVLILGILMSIPMIANMRLQVEGWILNFIPSLNHLKLMATEKLDLENAVTKWKPVLVSKGDQYFPAYVIEENSDWIIIALAKVPTTEPKDMQILKRSSVIYQEITMKQMGDFNKAFGKGYLSIIN